LEDLLRIKIKLPPLEDQIRISKNRLEFIQQQSLTVKSSSNTITDVDIFKAIKHEIVNILKGPEGFLDLLPSFLINNQISLTKPIIDAVGVETVGQMIERSQENIKQIFTVLENLKGILFSDEKYFNPQKVDLRSFLKNNLMRQFTNSNLKWYVGTMGYFEMTRSVYAEIDTEQFDCLIRNIVSNVVNHGISGNELKFLINIENSPDFIQIHFMNNGNPFPADFNLSDYIAFGRKHGNSKGQGLGGYLIHKVVENHHGLLDILPGGQIFSIPNDNGTETIMVNVDILISIPKKQ
jgi:type I restriction enzyme M protein